MCRSRTNRAARLTTGAITAIGLGAWLAGCSDVYWDRRDTIALGAGNDVAANTLEQMVDPWPAYSGDKNIPFNGEKMEDAVKRYRTGKVIAPEDSQAATSGVTAPSQSVTQVNVGGGSSPSSGAASTPGQ
jgi:hypothetical protein